MQIDLSIVIITWKMRDLLQKCLTTIYQYTSEIKFEIILIDNNSQDGTVEMIENSFPQIQLIKNEVNRGVAPARNQGLKLALGKYILILDADMELIENSILSLFKFMERTPSCGIVGAKLVDSYKNLQYSCKRFPSFFALVFRRLENFSLIENSKTLSRHMMKEWDHKSIKEVDYLIGACQFFRKEVIDKIGFYDDKIFYGPEDIDFCLRVWNGGWKVCYFPLTQIIHHEQRITKNNFFSAITFKHLLGIIYIYLKYKGRIKVHTAK